MNTSMKAIAFQQNLATDHPECFVDLEQEKPQPIGRQLLVQVKAVSVNPVDMKVRTQQKEPLA